MNNRNIREHFLTSERYVNRCIISLNVSLFLDLGQRDSHILRMDRKVVLGDTALALEQRWCAVAHNSLAAVHKIFLLPTPVTSGNGVEVV
jgi:hypothetical protein